MNLKNIDFRYPDLSDDIELLNSRLENVSEEHKNILKKWIEQLSKINKQMRQIERIESFSIALTEKDK